MEIRTKFGIGDKVWTLINARAKRVKVSSLYIDCQGVRILCTESYHSISEEECFATKDELLEYTFGEAEADNDTDNVNA